MWYSLKASVLFQTVNNPNPLNKFTCYNHHYKILYSVLVPEILLSQLLFITEQEQYIRNIHGEACTVKVGCHCFLDDMYGNTDSYFAKNVDYVSFISSGMGKLTLVPLLI